VNQNIDFSVIRKALVEEFGEPLETLSFRHEGESDSVPTSIDVLCLEPSPNEQTPEGDWYTYLLTCGLATRKLTGSIERFEFLLSVRRHMSGDERRQLGRRLAELGAIPFRDGFGLEAEMILSDITLPLFEHMDHAVLSLYGGGEYLATQPPIAMVHVTPVFASEAEQIRSLSIAEAFYRFALAGVKRDDPDREEIDLRKVKRPMTNQKKEAPSTLKVAEVWQKLESRLDAKAGTRDPADERSIRNLLDYVTDDIPKEFIDSLRRHDGAEDLNGYELFSIDKLLEVRKHLLEQLHSGSFEGRSVDPKIAASRMIEPDWWNAGWIPFAAKGPDKILFMDQFPGKDGTEGQILEWEASRGPVKITGDSFVAWLDGQLKDLK
jgi:cell wall assembly regulator SMI1